MAATGPASEVVSATKTPNIVTRVLNLPVVSDVYSTLARWSVPLQPYMAATVGSIAPIVDSSYSSVKESVSNGVNAAKDQASSTMADLDTNLCSGLDRLVDQVPALQEPTPDLYVATKGAAAGYAFSASVYLASFTLAQLVLKISDSGLETADSILKLYPGEQLRSLAEGLGKVRRGASSVREEGAKKNGSEKVKHLQEASVLGALREILGIDYLLSLLRSPDGAVVKEAIEEATEAIDGTNNNKKSN